MINAQLLHNEILGEFRKYTTMVTFPKEMATPVVTPQTRKPGDFKQLGKGLVRRRKS